MQQLQGMKDDIRAIQANQSIQSSQPQPAASPEGGIDQDQLMANMQAMMQQFATQMTQQQQQMQQTMAAQQSADKQEIINMLTPDDF